MTARGGCRLPTVPCVLQLDQICISFDKGKTTMNFIEAALLIQGSACVYSKKVGPAWLRSGRSVCWGQGLPSRWGRWQAQPCLSCPSSTSSHLLLQALAPFNTEEQNGFTVAGLGNSLVVQLLGLHAWDGVCSLGGGLGCCLPCHMAPAREIVSN